MGHYFVAYSRRDFYFAESLFYALHSQGVNAWMDVWKITPGEDWDNAITDAVESCEGFILIATKDSLHSPYVRDEICRAYQACKPIYLVIRGRISKRALHVVHEYPNSHQNSVELVGNVQTIVDMRASFPAGIARLAAAIAYGTAYRDKLPSIFSRKAEPILYIPPALVFLVLFAVVTALWKYGAEILFPYDTTQSQFMAYIRDIVQGNVSEVLLLVPAVIGSIAAVGALVNVVVFGINYARRKRVAVSYFTLLIASAIATIGWILFKDVLALIEYVSALVLNASLPNQVQYHDITLLLLVALHGTIALLVGILAIAFRKMMATNEGRGAILRWLPTGLASTTDRRIGNQEWIRQLPEITVSPSPSFHTFYIVASPEDRLAASKISSMFQKKGYTITSSRANAECDIIILSAFADDTPLRSQNKGPHQKPAVYVVSRSIKPPNDVSIALQWIDFRAPTEKLFWNQWERHFSSLKAASPTFPNVPEALEEPRFLVFDSISLILIMLALGAGCAVLVSGLEYAFFASNDVSRSLLLASTALLVGAIGITYFTIAQILRAVISIARVKHWLGIAGLLVLLAAVALQSRLLIIGAAGVVLVNTLLILSEQPGLRSWLPPTSRKPNRRSLLQPTGNYRAVTNSLYTGIMILGVIGLNAVVTNNWIVPGIPSQSSSKPYEVTVPGPYYLAAPGLWSQDTDARAFGYHFDYHADKLEISQDQAVAYPTWLKFLGTSSSPMRFAPHFTSSIDVQFTNNELQTDFAVVLNNFVGYPGGPQFHLSASGLWTVVESDGTHFSGQIPRRAPSHDYTIEIELNGILCTYKINGNEVAVIADKAATRVNDILFNFINLVPGGTRFFVSNFTYSPVMGPVLGSNEAMNIVKARNAAPYSTTAPGWNCNPDAGRWNSWYEPDSQSTMLNCTEAGTVLNTSTQQNVLLDFDNSQYGGLPADFDYSFRATFQGSGLQCVIVSTFANVTVGIVHTYLFGICSDGTWRLRYAGYYASDGSVFLNQQLRTGHITVGNSIMVFAKFRTTTQQFYVNDILITSNTAEGLMPSILFTNDHGRVLYSSFSYIPRYQ